MEVNNDHKSAVSFMCDKMYLSVDNDLISGNNILL